jgi:hypothetical protein
MTHASQRLRGPQQVLPGLRPYLPSTGLPPCMEELVGERHGSAAASGPAARRAPPTLGWSVIADTAEGSRSATLGHEPPGELESASGSSPSASPGGLRRAAKTAIGPHACRPKSRTWEGRPPPANRPRLTMSQAAAPLPRPYRSPSHQGVPLALSRTLRTPTPTRERFALRWSDGLLVSDHPLPTPQSAAQLRRPGRTPSGRIREAPEAAGRRPGARAPFDEHKPFTAAERRGIRLAAVGGTPHRENRIPTRPLWLVTSSCGGPWVTDG